MTLKVRIENEGNQPSDAIMFRGFKWLFADAEKGTEAAQTIQWTGNPDDVVTLMSGQAVIFHPNNTGHFDDFQEIAYKGQH